MRRMEAGRISLSGGTQEFGVIVKEGDILLECVDLFPALVPESGRYEGLELCHRADQIEGDISIDRMEGMQMDRRGQVLSRFGKRFHTDGFIEADMLFYELDSECPAGLFLRVSEDSSYPAQIQAGYRGYFVGFDGNEMFLWRMDFGRKELCVSGVRYRHGRIIGFGWKSGKDSLPYGSTGSGSYLLWKRIRSVRARRNGFLWSKDSCKKSEI